MERYFAYLFSTSPFTGKITDNLLPWSDKMIENNSCMIKPGANAPGFIVYAILFYAYF
ncbi:MAG: hypothetical protein Q4G33_08690 [bacterium]|nr:hypothetical protein [bacterium]